MLFSACETDFDVNAEWEETTVVYGLLDASDQNTLQKIKISKAFLGNMDGFNYFCNKTGTICALPNNRSVRYHAFFLYFFCFIIS